MNVLKKHELGVVVEDEKGWSRLGSMPLPCEYSVPMAINDDEFIIIMTMVPKRLHPQIPSILVYNIRDKTWRLKKSCNILQGLYLESDSQRFVYHKKQNKIYLFCDESTLININLSTNHESKAKLNLFDKNGIDIATLESDSIVIVGCILVEDIIHCIWSQYSTSGGTDSKHFHYVYNYTLFKL